MENRFSNPNTELVYQRYNAFTRAENEMIRKYYGDCSIEESRRRAQRISKQKREEFEKKIKEIMEKANVPRWKAELYYYYSSDTREFLYFREKRLESNFKNEIKRYFNEDFEDECITTIDWQELYEILGPVPYFGKILGAITKILENIAFSAEKKETLPYIFEEKIVYSWENTTPDFSMLKCEDYEVLDKAIRRYLLTELPKCSVISLNFFEKLISNLKHTESINAGFSHIVEKEYAYTKILCVKTEFSYSNKK